MTYEEARRYLAELQQLVELGPGPRPEAVERFDEIRREFVWDDRCDEPLGRALAATSTAIRVWFGKHKPDAPVEGARVILMSHLAALDRMVTKDFSGAPLPR